MNNFKLSAVFEGRELPGGIRSILQTDFDLLVPPRWADGITITDSCPPFPDALLLVVNGPLSPDLRRIYYQCFRRDLPIAALCYGDIPEDDGAVAEMKNNGQCWVFSSPEQGRELVSVKLQGWLKRLNREHFPFPQGAELLESYGDLDGLSVDPLSLDRAREVLQRRGFVCLSGPIGAGKTSIARKLLKESWDQGLNPIEVITRDLDSREVVQLLTGPEDCAVLLDLDTLRRIVEVYPAKLWSMVLSLMIRATETRHRLILATSSPRLSKIFDSHDDAHVKLPEPSTERKWRLEQAREALEWFRGLDSMRKAELLVLAAFDPVVAEAVFKRTLFSLSDRIVLQESSRFPTNDELEQFYSESLACRGTDPFRRIRGSGEVYLTVSDSVRMWAIDRGIRELLEDDSSVMRAFADTLIESDRVNVRRAGYFLAGFYSYLSGEIRARLLLHIASEKSLMVLLDVLSMLLSSAPADDESVHSMYRIMVAKGSTEVRMAVARTLGRQSILESNLYFELVERIAEDPEAAVRGQLLQDLTMHGMCENGRGARIYRKLLEDTAFPVRRELVLYLGSKFPALESKEFDVLNEVLEDGSPELITPMIMGLLDRTLEEFNQEFNDLLWVLMERLPPGGKGRLAWRIGARLRFFSGEVRESLRSDLTEKDVLPVTRCLLMNFSSLTAEEKNTLWEIISERISYSREFASMVLRYYNIMDPGIRERFLADVLESDNYQGRDALGQLICLGREDLVESTLQLVETTISEEAFEKRAGLPFFLLWNRDDLGDSVRELLRRLASDPSSYVRRTLVRAVRALGLREEHWVGLLEELSSDEKRAVRASVATTLGEFETGGEQGFNECLRELLRDEDAYVRLSAISGLLNNVFISSRELLPVLLRAFEDSASEVRLVAVRGLRRRPDLQDIPEVDKSLADRFADSDRSVRMEVVKLVIDIPGLLGSDIIRNRMPDILLNRLSTGHAIAEELNMARKIQMDLLPDDPPSPDRCDIEVFYRPAREVGGDYYDFFDLPDRNLGMAVADVAGKGIPAALTMAGLKGNLEAYVQSIYSISDIMQKVNESSVPGEGDPIITGLFYGVLDLASGMLTFVNAGHNPPFLVKREGDVYWLEKGGLVLGLTPEAVYEHDSVRMESGDVLVLYTDGLTEAMDSLENEFGAERLKEVVRLDRDLSASQIAGAILEAVNTHSGGSPQGDDQTLVVVKYK